VAAREAQAMGLVSEVVPDAEVIPHALKLARTDRRDAAAGRAADQGGGAGWRWTPRWNASTRWRLERKANQLLFATRDQKEGMQAFCSRSAGPKFEGR
jgi:enoyl-CoA hydratase